jgi:manganese/iron transport system permease protein
VTDAILDPLHYDFFVRALAASVMVGMVCAVVGSYVVLKGLAFMGDAISHAAFPGIVVAYLAGRSFYLLGAGIAAIATSLAITWVSRRGRLRTDTAIGVLFAGTFAFGVLLFSTIQGYVGDLFHLLFGYLLGISEGDLLALLVLGAGVLAVVALLWKELLFSTFDPLGAAASGIRVSWLEYGFMALVAATIVISLQAVGIVLVVAMLVTPAATAQLLTVRFGRLMAIAVAVGVGSAVLGLYVSLWFDVASGATIVVLQTGLFLAALLLGPRTGLLGRRRPRPLAMAEMAAGSPSPAGVPISSAEEAPPTGRARAVSASTASPPPES